MKIHFLFFFGEMITTNIPNKYKLKIIISLAGCVAVEHMGGPHIEWTGGRRDNQAEAENPPINRLPDGALGKDHVLDVFVSRMGFTVQETVALIGAHTVGRCHANRSVSFIRLFFKKKKKEV